MLLHSKRSSYIFKVKIFKTKPDLPLTTTFPPSYIIAYGLLNYNQDDSNHCHPKILSLFFSFAVNLFLFNISKIKFLPVSSAGDHHALVIIPSNN